jgi:hypothetical protein
VWRVALIEYKSTWNESVDDDLVSSQAVARLDLGRKIRRFEKPFGRRRLKPHRTRYSAVPVAHKLASFLVSSVKREPIRIRAGNRMHVDRPRPHRYSNAVLTGDDNLQVAPGPERRLAHHVEKQGRANA